MQTFTGQFYVNEKVFALGSQVLFPVGLFAIQPGGNVRFFKVLDKRHSLSSLN